MIGNFKPKIEKPRIFTIRALFWPSTNYLLTEDLQRIRISNGIYYTGQKYFRYFVIKPSINFPNQWAILYTFTDEKDKVEHEEYEEIVKKLGRRMI